VSPSTDPRWAMEAGVKDHLSNLNAVLVDSDDFGRVQDPHRLLRALATRRWNVVRVSRAVLEEAYGSSRRSTRTALSAATKLQVEPASEGAGQPR
jgi:hypothetical protein